MIWAVLDLSLENPFGNFLVSKRQGVLAFFNITTITKLYEYEKLALFINKKLNIIYGTVLVCVAIYLTIILRNRAEYHLILSRRGRRPSRLKSGDIPQD